VEPKPPSQGFKFPPVPPPTTKSNSQAAPKPDLFPRITPAEASSISSPAAAASLQRSTTPPQSPPRSPVDRDRLTADLARIALVRQDGLIRKYIEFTLPDLVRTSLNQYRLEVHDAAVGKCLVSTLRRQLMICSFSSCTHPCSEVWSDLADTRLEKQPQPASKKPAPTVCRDDEGGSSAEKEK
jgi:hypothetical protein